MTDYETRITEAAQRAACLTRQEYIATGLEDSTLCYDLARDAARDRGYSLRENVDLDPTPTNPGSALLKMLDDIDALKGLPRTRQAHYAIRLTRS